MPKYVQLLTALKGDTTNKNIIEQLERIGIDYDIALILARNI